MDQKKASPLEPRAGERRELALDLVALRKEGAFKTLPLRRVSTLSDPAYKRPAEFRGYALHEVLGLMQGWSAIDWSRHEVRFIAEDGYAVVARHEDLQGGNGVLATELLGAPEGKRWESFVQGKRTMTPAPFFLVWEGEKGHKKRPWPYQVVRIEVVKSAEAFAAAFPSHDPSAQEGFALFKKNCLSCHSVNLVGGKVGPELNVPRNITELWREEHLPGFIRDAPSYRARTAMPPFKGLTGQEIEKILHYLRAMKHQKVCKSAEECAKAP